jgi:hypothetical protein
MLELGITTSPTTPAGFADFAKQQVGHLAPMVRNAGVRL